MRQATTLFLLATIGVVFASQVDNQYAMINSQVEESNDQQWEAMYDEEFVRAQVESEIERAFMDEEWWNFLPEKTRDALRPILNTTGNIGNQLFDMMQANLNRQMKDLTGDSLGLLGLIPDEIRSVASPITRLLADPSSKLVDFLQEQVNKGFRNFAQTEASVETMSEDEKVVVQKMLAQVMIRAQLQSEIAEVLAQQSATPSTTPSATKDPWAWVPEKDRKWIRKVLDVSNPIANDIFDKLQAGIYGDLKDFGTNDAGIFNLIPQDFRTATGGIATAFADPLNSIVDKLQEAANKRLRQFPQKKAKKAGVKQLMMKNLQ